MPELPNPAARCIKSGKDCAIATVNGHALAHDDHQKCQGLALLDESYILNQQLYTPVYRGKAAMMLSTEYFVIKVGVHASQYTQ